MSSDGYVSFSTGFFVLLNLQTISRLTTTRCDDIFDDNFLFFHFFSFKNYSEALHAWRAKARCNIVPAERLHELFEELKFSPSEKQSKRIAIETVGSLSSILFIFLFFSQSVNEMLQTAKLFARRGCSGFDSQNSSRSHRPMNGLTFGEFCVLAADLKRFRTQGSVYAPMKCPLNDKPLGEPSSSSSPSSSAAKSMAFRSDNDPADNTPAPEVFLGGSCNPTTWRADVAIPLLNKLNISFYNPVSDSLATWPRSYINWFDCSKYPNGHQI